jgi:hypothetical protein
MTEHIKVFTGSSIIVNCIKNILEEHNISSLLKDHTESARLGGFGIPTNSVELFILQEDLEKAQPILDDFKAEINSY